MTDNYIINTFLEENNTIKQISNFKISKNLKEILDYKLLNAIDIKKIEQIYVNIIKIIIENENLKVKNINFENGDGKIKTII